MFRRHASFRLSGCHFCLFIDQALGLHCHDLERSQNLSNGLRREPMQSQVVSSALALRLEEQL